MSHRHICVHRSWHGSTVVALLFMITEVWTLCSTRPSRATMSCPECSWTTSTLLANSQNAAVIVGPKLDNFTAFEPSQFGNTDDHVLRFAGVGRLYQKPHQSRHDVLDRLQRATVAVMGIGGVGSWTAEALGRSGVGNIVLVDLDDVCISNTNRQVHALVDTVGRFKVDVLKERLLRINPHCNVTTIHDFVSAANVHAILDIAGGDRNDLTAVVDAIDGAAAKAAILAACCDYNVPVITCGAAAGRADPTQIVCDDLTRLESDKLLRTCRKVLRQQHGFAPGLPFHVIQRNRRRVKRWNILGVSSSEPQKEIADGTAAPVSSLRRCDGALGTASFVTGAFGMTAAAQVVDMIANDRLLRPRRG